MKASLAQVEATFPKFDWKLVSANNFPACQTELVEKTCDDEVLQVTLTMEDGTEKKALVSGELSGLNGAELHQLLDTVYDKVKNDTNPVPLFEKLLRH